MARGHAHYQQVRSTTYPQNGFVWDIHRYAPERSVQAARFLFLDACWAPPPPARYSQMRGTVLRSILGVLMAESISFQRLRSRIEQLEQHMQAVDLAISYVLAATKPQIAAGGTILGALGRTHARYSRLKHPINHAPRIFNFSKSLNFKHAYIELYRYFGEYLRGLLEEMYAKDPMSVVGKIQGNSLQFCELVSLGSYSAIVRKMIDTTFRRLEDERSTKKLLDRVLAHTNIAITQVKKDNALKHLEMRHLFIHNNGKCDAAFEKSYGAHFGLREGDDLPTNYIAVSTAIRSVVALLEEIDHLLISAGFIPARA